MTTRSAQTIRQHATTFREDTTMIQFRLQFAEVRERQALLRSIRDADRAAHGQARSLRLRLGASLMRLGRRVGGDALANPAWQG
jgi:hypothetical protein